MTPDVFNAIFEAGGALLLCLNVRRLYQDKRLAGVALAPTVWFNVWGAWNLYYYHSIGQRWSWAAGMAVFAVNTAWVALAIWYRTGRNGRDARPLSRLQAAVAAADKRRAAEQQAREDACAHVDADSDSFDGRPVCRDCGARE